MPRARGWQCARAPIGVRRGDAWFMRSRFAHPVAVSSVPRQRVGIGCAGDSPVPREALALRHPLRQVAPTASRDRLPLERFVGSTLIEKRTVWLSEVGL